jgi:radical SAM protein with 4Fe4S-binding SPASM domain
MTLGATLLRPLRFADFPKLVAVRREAARRAALFEHPDLSYLFWESTLRCNLRCKHCGSSCGPDAGGDELSSDEVLRILDTIAQDFDPRRIFVSITGGEPLMRPDLVRVVEHMTSLGMRACIVTNGVALDAHKAVALRQAGTRTISISVDGTRESHEAIRGPGTWSRALAAIGHARDAGFAAIEAITCVRPANLGSLSRIERIVREAGAGLWRLITIDRMGRLSGCNAPEMWLGGAQVAQLLEFIKQRRAQLRQQGDSFHLQFSCGGFLGVGYELSVRPQFGQCYAGLCVASILCDGLVSGCPSLPRHWAQGSARSERFSAIWRNRFGAFRDLGWRRAGVCADCSWFKVCLGGGLHERLAQPEAFCWLDRQRE